MMVDSSGMLRDPGLTGPVYEKAAQRLLKAENFQKVTLALLFFVFSEE